MCALLAQDPLSLVVPGGGSSGFTPGSIIFADAGGRLSQNNAQLFWDNALNMLTFVDTHLFRINAATLGTDTDFWISNGDIRLGDFGGGVRGLTVASAGGFRFMFGPAQKMGFWGGGPIVQPTAAGAAAAFVSGTSGTLNDSATWDGYTIGQVVRALRSMGLLA